MHDGIPGLNLILSSLVMVWTSLRFALLMPRCFCRLHNDFSMSTVLLCFIIFCTWWVMSIPVLMIV